MPAEHLRLAADPTGRRAFRHHLVALWSVLVIVSQVIAMVAWIRSSHFADSVQWVPARNRSWSIVSEAGSLRCEILLFPSDAFNFSGSVRWKTRYLEPDIDEFPDRGFLGFRASSRKSRNLNEFVVGVPYWCEILTAVFVAAVVETYRRGWRFHRRSGRFEVRPRKADSQCPSKIAEGLKEGQPLL